MSPVSKTLKNAAGSEERGGSKPLLGFWKFTLTASAPSNIETSVNAALWWRLEAEELMWTCSQLGTPAVETSPPAPHDAFKAHFSVVKYLRVSFEQMKTEVKRYNPTFSSEI